MKPIVSGWIKEAPKFKDYSHERTFGASAPETIVPLNRSIDGIPLIYQGSDPSCVSCSATWIKEWMETNDPSVLSWKYLSIISNTTENGVKPSSVLKAAKKIGIATDLKGTDADKHKIPGYFFITKCKNPNEIYKVLKKRPVMIGVDDYEGVGAHMMVAFDASPVGAWETVNWWDASKQQVVQIPFDQVTFACYFAEVPDDVSRNSIITTIISKIAFIIQKIVCSISK